MVDSLISDRAERACLGAALLDNSLVPGPLSRLTVDDFALSANREIFALILEAHENGEPFDLITVVESLRQRNKLETAGDAGYVACLIDDTLADDYIVERYVDLLIRLSQLRRLQKLGDALAQRTIRPGVDPNELLQQLEQTVFALKQGCDLDGNLLPTWPRALSCRPDLLTLAEVQAKPIDWLWAPFLAAETIAMLSGDPGAGKTYISLAIAAAVTTGHVPCTGEPSSPANVLYLSVENSPEHVIRPRFDLLGGNPSRFHILRGYVTGEGKGAARGIVHLSDVSLLGEALQKTRARLVVIDPVQSYLGANVDAHRSNETRPVLDGLSRLSQENKCCILMVRHLSKAQTGRSIHRGLGSIDFTGAARTELIAGSSPEDPDSRAMVQVKSNLGKFGPALGYSIEGEGTFRWTGKSELTASVLLSPEINSEDNSALNEACDFLREFLADGPRPSKDVQDGAKARGISWATVRRAIPKAGIRHRKAGFQGQWLLELQRCSILSKDTQLLAVSTFEDRVSTFAEKAE